MPPLSRDPLRASTDGNKGQRSAVTTVKKNEPLAIHARLYRIAFPSSKLSDYATLIRPALSAKPAKTKKKPGRRVNAAGPGSISMEGK
jgi:hypothetical protein